DKNGYKTRADAFDTGAQANNAMGKPLEDRTENHLDAVDVWKKQCLNKSYDEQDEKFVRREIAAAASATSAASAASAAK
ncbi:MAG TPA: hypothetical protein VGE47_00795, partial [Burkholderiaceae bacterium]